MSMLILVLTSSNIVEYRYEGRVFYQWSLAAFLCMIIGLYLTILVECDTMLIRYNGFKLMTVEKLGG